jgi:hypothetical protein
MPKVAKQENGSRTYEDVATARRNCCSHVVVKDDGTSALIDERDVAKRVTDRVKERLRDDMHVLFANYLLNHVPMALAQLMKEDGFTHPDGSAYLPYEFIVIWKDVVSDDGFSYATEKESALHDVERPFKDYIRKYVRTIVANVK